LRIKYFLAASPCRQALTILVVQDSWVRNKNSAKVMKGPRLSLLLSALNKLLLSLSPLLLLSRRPPAAQCSWQKPETGYYIFSQPPTTTKPPPPTRGPAGGSAVRWRRRRRRPYRSGRLFVHPCSRAGGRAAGGSQTANALIAVLPFLAPSVRQVLGQAEDDREKQLSKRKKKKKKKTKVRFRKREFIQAT
jgi:hypothetical protein